ncbi:hypothetical protein, partial [Seonamhaeicola sediminis]|uniref:hypothetical protein n=1 Tax=Seonamhaeicola sediminis TaxID=2528206 RepID=UPI001C964C68
YSVKKSNLLEIHKIPNNIIDIVEIIFNTFFIFYFQFECVPPMNGNGLAMISLRGRAVKKLGQRKTMVVCNFQSTP